MHTPSAAVAAEKEAKIARLEAVNAQLLEDYCSLTDKAIEELKALRDVATEEFKTNVTSMLNTQGTPPVDTNRGILLARISTLYQVFELLNQPRPRFIMGATYPP